MSIEFVDLTKVTRGSDKVGTTIYIHMRNRYKWLEFGQMELRQDVDPNRIIARGHATDFEHDAIYILRLPVLGVRLESINYGVTVLEAYVYPNDDPNYPDFRVPSPGYNPMGAKGARMCRECGDHVIVPEEFTSPSFDEKLYNLVRGRKITIHTGLRRVDE